MILRFEHFRVPETEDDAVIASNGGGNDTLGDSFRYRRGGPNRAKWKPDGKGGCTRCTISIDQGNMSIETKAVAGFSPDDHFCYAKGRALALRRALAAAFKLDDEVFRHLGVREVA